MRSTSIVVIIALVLVSAHAQYTKEQTQDFFLWSAANGDNVIIFNDGTLKTVGVQWVGLSAWFDLFGIKLWYDLTIASGQVPYFHDYSLGTLVYNTRDITYSKALDFSVSLAKMIGNSFAIVDLDTEWDANGVAPFAVSAAGIQSFKDRIQAFRTYAPNAILTSSPGLWTAPWGGTLDYRAFTPIDGLLDYRSVLYTPASNDPGCTWRTLAGQSQVSVYTDGKTLTQAVNTAQSMNANRNYQDVFWGPTNKNWFAADVAITDCGWGVTGQAAIVQNLVDNLASMFAKGFRGMNMRNYSPPNEYRFMGQNNEEGFTWYPPHSGKNNTSVVMQRGLDIALQLMRAKAPSGNTGACSSPGTPTTTPTAARIGVLKITGWNSWWIQISLSSTTNVRSVVASYTDGFNAKQSVTLTKSQAPLQYHGSVPKLIPNGAAVTFTITLNDGTTQSTIIYNGDALQVTKVLPGWNSWWTQVKITPLDNVNGVTASYTDASNVRRTFTLTKNPSNEYQGAPTNQIPFGASVTINVNFNDGSTSSQSLTNGQQLTVGTVVGAFNRWWIQVAIQPNTDVILVQASFNDASGTKREVTLSWISGTNQYMGNPTVQMPSNAAVTITVTLKDNTKQVYTVTNPAYRSEESEEPAPSPSEPTSNRWIISVLVSIIGLFVATTGLALVVIGVMKRRRNRGNTEEQSYVPLEIVSPTSPGTPVDSRQSMSPQFAFANPQGEENVEIQDLPL